MNLPLNNVTVIQYEYILLQAMKTAIINFVHALGMHHHGARQLEIGEALRLEAEPDNPYDHNTIMVKRDSRTCAYLSRKCARVIAQLLQEGKCVGPLFAKPKFEATVHNHRLGPQQSLAVGFKCHDADGECIAQVMRSYVAHTTLR